MKKPQEDDRAYRIEQKFSAETLPLQAAKEAIERVQHTAQVDIMIKSTNERFKLHREIDSATAPLIAEIVAAAILGSVKPPNHE